MEKFKNCVAVITGAGSGIGQHLALELAKAGAQLAISDINHVNLQATEKALEQYRVKVIATPLDVADEYAFLHYATFVQQQFNKVNLVINNAGVALSSDSFAKTPLEDFKWLMNINFFGVLYGTKFFLPILEKADWGHIVNISSLFGLIGVPSQSAYNSSKFAVRGLTEALRQELDNANSHVSCTSVHPGGVKTDIARNARVIDNTNMADKEIRKKAIKDFDQVARTTAESAAQQILNAVLKNKRRLLIGSDAKFLDKVQRLLPSAYPKILKRFL